MSDSILTDANSPWQTAGWRAAPLLAALVVWLVVGFAQRADAEDRPSYLGKRQVGIRLGVWSNRGETPPKEGQVNEEGTFSTNIKESAFYFEGFYSYPLLPWTSAELSLGSVNRGSVTINEGTKSDIGNLIIYPVLVQFKVYPAFMFPSKFQPYLLAGGGLLYGRRTVQFTSSGSYYSNWAEESSTDFSYVLGGGIDYLVAGPIGLDFTVKYMPIKLSLVTIEDYDAVAFALGVKYLY